MAGIRLDDAARVIWFGVVDPSRPSQVVTVAGSSTALPGTQVGGGKVSDYRGVPRQGAGHRRSPGPALPQGRRRAAAGLGGARAGQAVSSVGKPVPLPDEIGRRDGSGVRLTNTIGAVGGALGAGPGRTGRTGRTRSAGR